MEPNHSTSITRRDIRWDELICRMFTTVLGLPHVGIDDDFFEKGGTSIKAIKLLSEIQSALDVPVTFRDLVEAPTPRTLALRLGAGTRLFDILPLRTGNKELAPVFLAHPVSGLSWCYAGLAQTLPEARPVYGLQAPEFTLRGGLPKSVDEMARDYIGNIRAIQPEGPYQLVGWSFGGILAHAVATRLQSQGQAVSMLAVLDMPPMDEQHRSQAFPRREVLGDILWPNLAADFRALDGPGSIHRLLEWFHETGDELAVLGEEGIATLLRVTQHTLDIELEFTPDVFDGDMLLFSATAPVTYSAAEGSLHGRWQPFVSGDVVNHDIACSHNGLLEPGPAGVIGAVLAAWLARRPRGLEETVASPVGSDGGP